jgi:hypothetical protein
VPAIDPAVIDHWVNVANNAANSTTRGQAWQHLGCYSFRRIPGVALAARNGFDLPRAREFDIAFRNQSDRTMFGFLDYLFLVECKYLSRPVSAPAVNWFAEKMKDRGIRDGVMFSTLGISGDPRAWTSGYNIVRTARREGLRILSLNLDQLRGCASSDDLVALCRRQWMQLALAR